MRRKSRKRKSNRAREGQGKRPTFDANKATCLK